MHLRSPFLFFLSFCRRRWYAWATFLLTPPVYSAVSNVAALKHSLVDLSSWGAPFVALWAAAMAAAAAAVAWHVRAAWRRGGAASFAVYVVTRAAVLLWFGASAAILARTGEVHIHLVRPLDPGGSRCPQNHGRRSHACAVPSVCSPAT
jgi:hypothetical protein